MTYAEKLAAAFAQAQKQPGAIVYAYKPAGPSGKARHGARDPFGIDQDGDPKIVIASGRIAARLAAMGYLRASVPQAKPAEVKGAQGEEESQAKRSRKKKEDEQQEEI